MPALPQHADVIPRSSYGDWAALWNIGAEPNGYPGHREELRTGYHRPSLIPYTRAYAAPVIQALGLQPARRTLIVGGGFGFLAELMRDEELVPGLGRWANAAVATLDPSPYIADEQAGTEQQEILALIQGTRAHAEYDDEETGGTEPAGPLRINAGDGKSLWSRLRDPHPRCRARFSSQRLDTQSSVNTVRSMFASNSIDDVVTDDGYLNYHSDAQIAEIFAALDQLGANRVCHYIYEDWGNSRSLSAWKALLPAHTFMAQGTWAVA